MISSMKFLPLLDRVLAATIVHRRSLSIVMGSCGFRTIENVIYKFTAEGKLLMTLGKRGVKGDNTSVVSQLAN